MDPNSPLGRQKGVTNVLVMFYIATMPKPSVIQPISRPPHLRTPARGALSNQAGRYEPYTHENADDGWDIPEDERLLKTEVSIERPKSVLTRNSSPDLSFDRSINPYRGCEHGCIYCFARPTHAYLGLSPGLDFETRLIARPQAADVLRRELSARSYQPQTIAIGTNTDPYQPIERDHRVMRRILEVLAAFNHPVTIVTKGTLVERDIDILGPMGQAGLARVALSVTTMDPVLSRKLEPRAPLPKRRLKTIARLADAGCPVRVMAAPVIPGLSDADLEPILGASAEAGACFASWIMLRLPQEVSPLFREWLATHYPDRLNRVMSKVRDMHGGQDYRADWGKRMRGEGPYAAMIGQRFDLACKRLGLTKQAPPLRTDLFAVPGRAQQLSLF